MSNGILLKLSSNSERKIHMSRACLSDNRQMYMAKCNGDDEWMWNISKCSSAKKGRKTEKMKRKRRRDDEMTCSML